jgi:hypothetical protein
VPLPAHEIGEKFWSWWAHLNAPIRLCTTNDGRFVPGLDGGKIAMETLRMPGKNGWLGLLYMLMFWRKWVGEGDTTDWEMAVVDVEWVTRRLCESTYYNATAEVIPTLKRYVCIPRLHSPLLIVFSFTGLLR